MSFVNYNSMNMLGMNNMFSSNMFSSNNISDLFSGTGSIFDCSGMFSMNNNIFNSNMFGGGCSIFTNCKGETNYGAMAGFGVVNVFFNIGGMAVSQLIQDKKANSAKTIQQDVNTLQQQINGKLKELGISDESKIKEVTVADSFTTEINNANNKVTNLKFQIEKLTEPASNNNESVDKYNNAVVKYNKNKADLEKLLEAAKKELKAAEEAKTKEVKRINALQVDLNDLIDKRNNAQAQLDAKTLDKANGNSVTRMSEKKFNDLFSTNNNKQITCNVADGKCKKSAVSAAVQLFQNATTEEQKKDAANKFCLLYNKLGREDQDDRSFSAAYKLISPYADNYAKNKKSE